MEFKFGFRPLNFHTVVMTPFSVLLTKIYDFWIIILEGKFVFLNIFQYIVTFNILKFRLSVNLGSDHYIFKNLDMLVIFMVTR